jgi:acid phosphatase class B
MKKITSAILALALCASITLPAFAGSSNALEENGFAMIRVFYHGAETISSDDMRGDLVLITPKASYKDVNSKKRKKQKKI